MNVLKPLGAILLVGSGLSCLVLLVISVGCSEPEAKQEAEPKKERSGIIGKTTQEIGEAKPDAEEADLQAKPGPLVAMGSYGFAVSEVSKIKIKQAVDLYNALHGHYPKDHDEFIREIIKKNNIQLPVLPGGRQYQYDVEKHELIVVEKESAE